MNKPRKKEFKKVCLFCGKNYFGITEKSRFCSKNCEKSYYHKQNYVPKPVKYITKICPNCKNEFQCETSKPNKKFCSGTCRDMYYKKYGNKKSRENNKIIETLRSQIEIKVNEIINKSKSNGDTYNNTTLDYRLLGDIPLEIRNIVLERDHNKCQICNSRNNLHIHHIVKRRNGGSHYPDNLITLCASCHRHVEIGDIDYAIEKCFQNAKNNYFNCGVTNTLERYEIIDKLTEIFNDVKNNYVNCNNLLISINELIEQI